MTIFSWIIFGVVRWKARHGLRAEVRNDGRNEARDDVRTGVRNDVARVRAAGGVAARAGGASDAMFVERERARQTGVRGETYAYWYLRRLGYVFVARNWATSGIKGELDLVGFDGETLAFVEVRTRTLREELTAMPELSVTTDKQHVLVRTAKLFMRERRVKPEVPVRFDVLAIDNEIGRAPEVRLHKDAFSPEA